MNAEPDHPKELILSKDFQNPRLFLGTASIKIPSSIG
jgi:hypothetical protein